MFIFTTLLLLILLNPAFGQTSIKINIPVKPIVVDPMIYGQMLENVNDSVIYGGIADLNGMERKHITKLIKPLNIPVMRWPGGTVVHEYHWKAGIGPMNERPTVETFAWKGKENYHFGTDEFLQWCKKIGSEPYINFNMSNQPEYGGTLQEALDWIEYVNGNSDTKYGKIRIANGHTKAYQVKFWGIGNENYGPWGRHGEESDLAYAEKLFIWASTIKEKYPDLTLMGVGHTYKWNKTVLEKCAEKIDFLTQHYYITSKVTDNEIENPENTLFAPFKMEVHLKMLKNLIDEANTTAGRENNPIRLSIDEWNNRHSINKDGQHVFSRNAARQQYDVAVVASMLNTFIRLSPMVSMANYIFPVNGHGLIRTVGNTDAYLSPLYPVFYQYRRWMVGAKLDLKVEGNGIMSSKIKPSIDGDASEIEIEDQKINYIDASAVQNHKKTITIALVNRNHEQTEQVDLYIPNHYVAKRKWVLESSDINASNTKSNRNAIGPKQEKLKPEMSLLKVDIQPCGLQLIQLEYKP